MVKINKVRKMLLNDMYEKRWDCREKKVELDFDNEFGVLITTTTREKIFTLLINIFKAIMKGDKDYVLKNMPRLLKMIKIHTFQLIKLNVNCVNVNIHYFREAVKTIYTELKHY
jgi:hypothetical protein